MTEKAKSFAAQMVAYRLAMEKATGKSVLATFVHFPLSGYLVNVFLKSAPDTFIEQCISAARDEKASAVV